MHCRRARKRAETDLTAINHANNVLHMHRRMEDQFTHTERKKNMFDPTIYPTPNKPSNQSGVCLDLSSWKTSPDRSAT